MAQGSSHSITYRTPVDRMPPTTFLDAFIYSSVTAKGGVWLLTRPPFGTLLDVTIYRVFISVHKSGYIQTNWST